MMDLPIGLREIQIFNFLCTVTSTVTGTSTVTVHEQINVRFLKRTVLLSTKMLTS